MYYLRYSERCVYGLVMHKFVSCYLRNKSYDKTLNKLEWNKENEESGITRGNPNGAGSNPDEPSPKESESGRAMALPVPPIVGEQWRCQFLLELREYKKTPYALIGRADQDLFIYRRGSSKY